MGGKANLLARSAQVIRDGSGDQRRFPLATEDLPLDRASLDFDGKPCTAEVLRPGPGRDVHDASFSLPKPQPVRAHLAAERP